MVEVAIVGMGCRLPGKVRGPDELWDFLLAHGDGIIEVPADRWSLLIPRPLAGCIPAAAAFCRTRCGTSTRNASGRLRVADFGHRTGLRPFAAHKAWAFVLESPFAGGDVASILREAISAVGDLASLQVAVEPRTVHNSEFAAEAAHKRRHIAIDQFH